MIKLSDFRISVKVFAVIGVLALTSLVITVTGILALKDLNQATDEMSVATTEAILGARMRQNVLALTRNEFRIAADPSGENAREALESIERQKIELEERLAAAEASAGPNQTKLLAEVRAAYEAYLKSLGGTVSVAQRNAGMIETSDAQRQVLAAAAASREVARGFEEAVGAYVEYTDGKAKDFSDEATAAYQQSSLLMGVVAGGGILIGLAVGWLVSRSGIVEPIRRAVACLRKLAEGDLQVEIYGTGRKDEIGDIADTMQVFKDNALEVERLKQEQAEAERRAEAEQKRAMNELADNFQASVGGIVQSVSSSATEMQTTAQSMSTTAEETSRQATAVAAASEQASSNVQTVASAAEELTSSIAEISRQVSKSAEIAKQAVVDAERTNVQVQGLADAAQKIGEVVDLINDIASQTNLLALNATIEAARAGEAGKGFAVVASEVKNLATETAKATDEITLQINSVQQATREAVSAIGSIGTIIAEINEIATTIASAVEEQGAATQEIARNVQQAAAGTTEVSSNISGVTQAAGETGAAATQVLSASGELAKQGEHLRAEVDRFLQAVRVA